MIIITASTVTRTRSSGVVPRVRRLPSSSGGLLPTRSTSTKDGPKRARLLAVMRLPPGPICTVAYIDRAANPNANALARKAADEIARTFKCGADVHIIGKRGEAINARFPPTLNLTP